MVRAFANDHTYRNAIGAHANDAGRCAVSGATLSLKNSVFPSLCYSLEWKEQVTEQNQVHGATLSL